MEQAHKTSYQADSLHRKREEGARKNFKHVLGDLLILLRNATQVETAILYWVNNARGIFVRETHATTCKNIMLTDRVEMEHLYLREFADLKEPVQLEVGKDLHKAELTHYFNDVPVSTITIVPFVNNGETVALTVLESSFDPFRGAYTEPVQAYENALSNLLQTYLQVSHISDDDSGWDSYETQLEALEERLDVIPLFQRAISELKTYLTNGSVTLICRGMGRWNTVLQDGNTRHSIPVGLSVSDHTIAWRALDEGKPQFEIHFNASPRRVSQREPDSKGATLALPILVEGHRHALILITDENPMIFTEEIRHKMLNMVRIVALKLASLLRTSQQDFLTGKHGAYSAEIIETAIHHELDQTEDSKRFNTFAGLLTLRDVPGLRAGFRMEILNRLQGQLVDQLNPQNFGYHGYLAMHSDYVFSFIIQSEAEDPVGNWYNAIQEMFQEPVKIGDRSVKLGFLVGSEKVTAEFDDPQEMFRSARQQLSVKVKNNSG